MKLEKYSIGVGDRFTHQGKAQLKAIMRANEKGLNICPVWNKSNREHSYVGTNPSDTRKEADEAVKALNFKGQYFVDADHINLNTVSKYVETSDFFTLDVASFIGKESSQKDIDAFVASCKKYMGQLYIPGIEKPLQITKELLYEAASKFLAAMNQASEIYVYLKKEKGENCFITEVSMDEIEFPQTPIEMLFILKMLVNKGVQVQTIAPKFTGRFNKGVDYVGDLDQFAKEFEEDVLVIDFGVKEFGLPQELKLSVHSGSDKFSIYPIMAKVIKKHDKGLHLKTAGTTWLEEVIGLSMSGGEG
ncbi:MAG: tagaturonate epimerase family protein [Dysgonamonadaceae bacterium]